MTIKETPEAFVRQTLEQGTFPEELLRSRRKVALIMTQSWCPQYPMMLNWLKQASAAPDDLDIYLLEYDEKPYYEDFMRFKEDILGNPLIPYVRYYRDGKLVGESNYVSSDVFFAKWKE